MKSIRTDNIRVTAKDLGVKVGDKFIVLPKEYSYKEFSASCLKAGDVVELIQDDNTSLPLFKCSSTGKESFEYFGRLARYEESVKEKIVLDKVKFDMVAIAKELGVPLETAHKFVQEMLFEKGCKWKNTRKRVPKWTKDNWLFVEDGFIHGSQFDLLAYRRSFTTLGLELKKSFVVKKQAPPEFIEVDGHKYALVK